MKKSEFTQAEERMIEQEFASLLDAYAHTSHRQHVERIEKAFRFANKAHYGVRRLSGEPYIMHPLAVAKIVVSEIGLGSTSISAALLHDVVEDTDYTVEDIDNLFGAKIAQIVDGLTKISGGVFGDKASEQAENFRKLLLTMSDDIRVVLIKIADRLHNMRTLASQPLEKQYKIAGETQYIYAPLAHRLGLGSIKSELENLAFQYEHPDSYAEIKARIEADNMTRMENFERFAQPIRDKLKSLGYEFDLTARIKTPYSIWRKMNTKLVTFEEIYDLLAVRIVFTPKHESLSEKDQCWMIYSAITEIYRPHPGRIRDWISTPKANGYEALHVTVMGQDGEWVEIQIRTRRMHELAEQGLAAHWRYKTGVTEETELDKWLRDIKEVLNSDSPDAMTFLDTFKLNLFAKEVFVFTPSGEIQTLPQGATVLDLAFQLHSELGEHCIGAKVNHSLKSIDYILHAGDQVEVLTAQQQEPKQDWLKYVVTAKAQSVLNTYFRKLERQQEKLGERRLTDALIALNIPIQQHDASIQRLQQYYHLTKRSELYKQIGLDAIKLDKLRDIISPKQSLWSRITPWGNKDSDVRNQNSDVRNQTSDESGEVVMDTRKDKQRHNLIITDEVLKDVILEDCCKPIPGDEAIAFKDTNGKMHVHYMNCPVAERLKSSYGKSIYSVTWDTHRISLYKEKLEIKGIDKFGLLIELLRVITENFNINVHELHITADKGVFSARIVLYVYDKAELYELINSLRKMHNIQSVQRVFT